MAIFRFRLQRLLDTRMSAKERAEQNMAERQRELRAEQENLSSLQRELEALTQKTVAARRHMLGFEPASAHRFSQRTEHLRGLEQDAEALHEALSAQKLVVEDAEVKLHHAREHLVACSREVDILTKFRDKLQRRFLHYAARMEEVEQDEAGNVIHLIRTRTR